MVELSTPLASAPLPILGLAAANPFYYPAKEASSPSSETFSFVEREEREAWPGFERVFGSSAGQFLKEKVVRPVLIAAAVFYAGERGFGWLCGARAMGGSCMWALYTLNFFSLIIGSFEYQSEKKDEIQRIDCFARSTSSDLSIQQSSNAQIEKLKSQRADNFLYWGFTCLLILPLLYFDRKSFIAQGPIQFSMRFPSYFRQGVSTILDHPLHLIPSIAALYGLYEVSSLWFDVYGRLGYGGLRQGSLTNLAASSFSTFALGVPLISVASPQILSCSSILGMMIGMSRISGYWEKGGNFLKKETNRFGYS